MLRPCDVVTDTHQGTLWVCGCVCVCVRTRVISHLRCRTGSDSFLRSSSPCESGSIWHCYPAEGRRGNEGVKEGEREGEIRGTAGVFQFSPLLLPLTPQFSNIKASIQNFVKTCFFLDSPCPCSPTHPPFPPFLHFSFYFPSLYSLSISFFLLLIYEYFYYSILSWVPCSLETNVSLDVSQPLI